MSVNPYSINGIKQSAERIARADSAEPVHSYQETLLSVEGVSQAFGDTQVLRDINIAIKNIHRPGLTQGQVVGFLGPSGVGKTQLFRILAGLSKPDSGSVLVTADRKPVKAGMMGVVAQHYPLFEHRTVWGNLVLAGQISGLWTKDAETKAASLLERFKLTDRAGYYAAEISGGQRQRIAIIQQLMCDPKFLLMDEPFSGLDPVMRDEACALISEVAATDEHLTIIVVTHDIAAAVKVSDTIWLMGRDRDDSGQIIPGAYIKEQINLIDLGIAWQYNHETLPEFQKCVNDIRVKFNKL